jgi:hypothetical protein
VGFWPSGWYATEITDDRQQWWMGTFDLLELSTHAYDAPAWKFDCPCAELNFSEVESR